MRDLRRVHYPPSPTPRPVKWRERKLVIRGYLFPIKNILLIVAISLLIIFLAAYFLIVRQKVEISPEAAIQKETKELTGRIGTFMELPVDEQPTLATVTDQEKLKDQNFFSHAQNGDKLLVYPKAKKAILYRPSTGKIIEVSNLISNSGQDNQAPLDIDSEPDSEPELLDGGL